MEQKCRVLSLFWLQVTIFETNEGCWGLEKDKNSQKWAFLGTKKTFFGFSNPFEIIKDFLCPKNSQLWQNIFFKIKKLFRNAGSGKNRPFMRPIRAYWPKTGHLKPIWSKNANFHYK
jgi:hypothetical protein